MSDGYRMTEETADYEIGLDGDVILAACRCGAGDLWPNKGLGRANAAAWKTRHQHTTDQRATGREREQG